MSVCTRNASCTCSMCTASLADMENISKPSKQEDEVCTRDANCKCSKCRGAMEEMAGISSGVIPETTNEIQCTGKDDCPCDDCKLPLEQRVLMKKLNVRKKAYADIKKILKENEEDPTVLSQYSYFILPVINDNNAQAQIVGLDSVLFYVQHCQLTLEEITEIIPDMINKILGGLKDTTSNKGCEIINILLDNPENHVTIFEILAKGLTNRKPKIPVNILKCYIYALSKFGPKAVPISYYYDVIGILGKATNQIVVKAFKNYIVELYRYVRETVKPWINKVNSNLITDLEPNFKEIANEPLPEVCGSADGLDSENYDDLPYVSIKKAMKEGDYAKKIENPKWNVKCEALDIIINTCGSHPKIEDGDYSELYSSLVKLVTRNSNLQIQIHGLNAIWCLIEGRRSDMKREAKGLLKWIIPYYKNKKTQLEESINKILESLTKYCISYSEASKILFDNMSSNQPLPQIRYSIMKYITSQLKDMPDSDISITLPAFISCFSDGNLQVREGIYDFSLEMLRLFGLDHSFTKQLLLQLKEQNIMLYKKVTNTYKLSNTSHNYGIEAPLSAGQTLKKTPSSPLISNRKGITPPASPVETGYYRKQGGGGGNKKISQPSSAKISLKKGIVTATKQSSINELPLEPMMSLEDAMMILDNSEIPNWEEIKVNITNTVWTEKSKSYNAIKDYVNSIEDNSNIIEPLLIYLYSLNKGFKVGVLNVALGVYEILQLLSQKSPKQKKLFNFMIKNTIEKISERRLSPYIIEIYSQSSIKISPKWTIDLIIPLIIPMKSMAIHVAILSYLSKAITDFGINKLDIKSILDYVTSNTCLQSPNSSAKSESLKVLISLYEQLGPQLSPMLTCYNLSNQLTNTVETTLSKAEYKADYVPPIEIESEEDNNGNNNDIMRSVDISKQLQPLLIKLTDNSNKEAWKNRNQAMSDLSVLLQSSFQIELTPTVKEIVLALRDRIKSESNQNLQAKAVEVLGFLAACVGPEITQFNKSVLPYMLRSISTNNRKNITSILYDTLDKWVDHDGDISSINSVIPYVAEVIKGNKNKLEVLSWLYKYLNNKQTNTFDCLVEPLVESIQDNLKAVRDIAESCLVIVVQHLGRNPIINATRDYKPAVLRQVQPRLDIIFESANINDNNNSHTMFQNEIIKSASPVQLKKKNIYAKTEMPATSISNKQSSGIPPPVTKTLGPANKQAKVRPNMFVDMENGGSNEYFILCSDVVKYDRINKDRTIWNTTVREEQYMNDVKRLIQPYIPTELFDLMFSKKDVDVLQALKLLIKAVQTNPDEVVSILDLLLKYVTLKLLGRDLTTQTSTIVDFYTNLFTMLDNKDYHFLDKEVSIMLPTILEKFFGSNKIRFVKSGHDLMNLIWSLYDSDKIVPYLIDQLDNKNKRVVTECLVEINILVRDRGSVAVPKKGLQNIIKLVGSDDKDIRNSALEITIQLYIEFEYVVERIYALVPDLPKKIQDLISERIKHSNIEIPDTKIHTSPYVGAKKTPPPPPVLTQQRSSGIPRYSPPRQKPTVISTKEYDYEEEEIQQQQQQQQQAEQYTDEDVYGNYNYNYDEDQYQYQYQYQEGEIEEGEGDNYVNADANVTALSSDSNISFLLKLIVSLGDSYADSPLYSREPLQQQQQQQQEEEETESDEEMPIIDKIILKLENIIIRYETGVLPYQIIDLYRGDHNDAVDSCKIIVKLVLDGDSIDELINMKWDKLVTDLIECARLSLGDNIKGSEVDSRMLSVTLSGFMAIFQQPKIAQLISEKSLENLLQLSLKGLLGDTLQENDQLKDLAQAFQHVLIRVLQSANTTLLLAAICQTLYLTSIKEKYVEQKLQVVLKMLDKIRHAERKQNQPYSRINCEIFIPSLNKIYSSILYKRYQNSMDLTLDDLIRDYVESQYELLQTHINKFSLQDVLYNKIMSLLQNDNNYDNNNNEEEIDDEDDSIIRLQEMLQNITQEITKLTRKEITSCPTIPLLYEFKQQHPQINIDNYLQELGSVYSTYITRELDTIAAKERTMNLTNNYLQSNTALDVKERLKQLKSQYNLPSEPKSAFSARLESLHERVLNTQVQRINSNRNNGSSGIVAPTKTDDPRMIAIREKIQKLREQGSKS